MAMRSPGPSVTKSHVSFEQRQPEHSLGWGFSRNVDWHDRPPGLDDRGGLRPERSRLEEVAGGCASEARHDRDAPSSAGPRKDRKGADRRRRSCFFCKEKVAAVDYKNIAQLRRFISERGKSRAAATRVPAGTTRSRSRSRSNARVRWRFCPTWVILGSRRRKLLAPRREDRLETDRQEKK